MSCTTCAPCGGTKQEYYSLAIDNPLYYTQTIGETTKFYQGISTFERNCDWPSCERKDEWGNFITKEAASVSYTLDDKGNYILKVIVNKDGTGGHGYNVTPDIGNNYSCSDGLRFNQKATIFNNGIGTTNAKLYSFSKFCCGCSYSATYQANNPYEEIEWTLNSDGCEGPANFIVCSPYLSYLTVAPAASTLCLPPDCPSSSDLGPDSPIQINMIKEVKAKDFLADQQKVIDIKKKFEVNYSNSLTNEQRTIPNPTSGGRLIRIKPSLSTSSLNTKMLQVEIKNENCDTLETIFITVSPSLNEEVQINLATYAVAGQGNPLWGPAQIGQAVTFKFTEIEIE